MNATAKVLLYSDDRTVRERVRVALGRRVASDLPELEIDEVATHHAVVSAVEKQAYQLCILDGEAVPAGGMGVAKQIKDEVRDCPPVLLLVARPQDAWLATWSGAEAISPYPVDPVRLPSTVAELLRQTATTSGA
ncbi:MAG: response regulator [Actinomycetia bacterium]|nr:response regulator [Actinomycetes bacterium]